MNTILDTLTGGAGWRQTDRLLTLTTPAGPDALLAETVHIDEALGPISEHAGYRIALTARSPDAHLSLTTLLGQPARLDLQTSASRTLSRPFHGHITQITREGSDGGFARYRLIIEPWLAFLGHTRDSYLFQDKSVIDIVDELLSDWKGQGKLAPAWRWQLADPAAYPKRGMTTQYRESDLAFLKRLLAEEGLFCWFERQADAGETLGRHPDSPAFFAGREDSAHTNQASLSGLKTQQLSISKSGQGGFNQLVFDDSCQSLAGDHR